MQFLLDNVVATLVVLVLTVLLLSATTGRQDEAVAVADHHANAGRTASIAHLLRQDFESVASVDAVSPDAIDLTVTLDVASMATGALRYRRDALPDGSFQVVRVDQTGAELSVGPPVEDWSVVALDSSRSPTTVPGDARAFRVRMVSKTSFARASDSLDVVWERVFSPTLLGSTQF